MAVKINFNPDDLKLIQSVDERLVSFNIEMTEVTGGTFWKSYTPEQIAGTESFHIEKTGDMKDVASMSEMMEYYPPIDLYNEKLRSYVKYLGPVWIRVSGSWATKTYYDFDGITGGKAPEGYSSVLTREQWIGVLDFVKAVKGKLLISVSNCTGDHPGGGALDLTQAAKIFDFSHAYGVDIDAAEFMNEPNMLEFSGAPAGYAAADYARDQDIFFGWVRKHYPNCILVGPCTTGDPSLSCNGKRSLSAGIAGIAPTCTTQALMEGTTIRPDIFSYHYYNGISERGASLAPDSHWTAEEASTDEYLSVAPECARSHAELRDKYVPGGQMWVTESGDAGAGGNTWASTYLDVLRTLNELGSFSVITDGVIFHNTLASSDYGFLEHGIFRPRPNYYAVLLWNRLMGTKVYDCNNPDREGAHVYCHSRRDKKDGIVYLVINNSMTETTTVELPCEAEQYTLSADAMRSSAVKLNDKDFDLIKLPEGVIGLGHKIEEGIAEVAPGCCSFFVL